MKKSFALVISLLVVVFSFGQIENNRALEIDVSGLNLNQKSKENSPPQAAATKSNLERPLISNYLSQKSISGLNYNSKIDTENFGTLQPLQMNFSTATSENRYISNKQPKYLQVEDGITQFYQRNQSLGDIRTNSNYLILKFRDHSNVDGDIVQLVINDKVVVSRANLVGSFSQVTVPLPEDGFYKIDFMALNMGLYAPNTAQLRIVDDKADTLMNDKWALYTGFKATVVVIKESF